VRGPGRRISVNTFTFGRVKQGIYLVLEPRPYAVNEDHCLGCAADLVLLYRALDLLRHEPRVDLRVDFSCNAFCVSVCAFVPVFLLLCKQVK
jgi:hypothetical protein